MKALIARRPDPIKRVFGASHGTPWLYEIRVGTDGIMTAGAMYAEVYERLWNLHLQNKLEEKREVFSKLLLIQAVDRSIPGARLHILRKRKVFKTMVSREAEYNLTPDEIAEIEYRFEALKPYLKV